MRSSRLWMRSSRMWMRSRPNVHGWDLADCGWDLAACGWGDLAACGWEDLAACGWEDLAKCGWDLTEWLGRRNAYKPNSQHPVLNPSILRRSRIWRAADEAVLNKVPKKSHKNPRYYVLPTQLLILLWRPIKPYKNDSLVILLERKKTIALNFGGLHERKDLLTLYIFWLPRYLHHSGVYHT
jgi:hypothetical protein